MKRSWIKLYLEILDDIEFGELPEFIKWRAIELFLVAGENGDDGLLPSVKRLAWRLRLDEVKITETLSALTQVGVVHETPEGWVVTHFIKRQEPMSSAERVKEYRKREDVTKRYKECNENVTDDNNESYSSSPSDSISDYERGGVGEKTKETPALHLFTDVLGKFHGEREIKRWLVIVDAVGEQQAGELIAWAEKKEIHLNNRPGLMDSLETAAKKWSSAPHITLGTQAERLKSLAEA